jgi:hypothetical protein
VRLPWRRARRLQLDLDALDRKRKALDALESLQLGAPSMQRDPNLCSSEVTRTAWPFEVLFT